MAANQTEVGVPRVGVWIGDEVLQGQPGPMSATHLAMEVRMPREDDLDHARHLDVERGVELEILDQRLGVVLLRQPESTSRGRTANSLKRVLACEMVLKVAPSVIE